jgi:formylglycine-generating enzyme required for sulfatase activity/sugar lactone lactonase YvrE
MKTISKPFALLTYQLFISILWLAAMALITPCLQAQNLFATAGTYSGAVYQFTPGGAQSTFDSPQFPTGIALDSAGNVYVAISEGETIYKYTPAGVRTTFATGILNPEGLAVDDKGNVFVASWPDSSVSIGYIYKFTPAGVQSTFASGLASPIALAFDTSGNLFVSDAVAGGGYIYKYTPSGARTTFASGISGFGLAFDHSDNLFFSDFSNGSIYKFTPDGNRTTFASGLGNYLYGLACDDNGNVYAASGADHAIYKFKPDGAQSTFASGLVQYPFMLAFPPPPRLHVSVVPDSYNATLTRLLIMFWWTNPPPLGMTLTLQSTTNLVTPNWTTVTNPPVLLNGQYVVTNPVSGPPRFYRLGQYPSGMALIPAGSFTMGDTLDGESDALPTNVTVSAFYMDTNLVSYSQWLSVYNWSLTNSYSFDNPGSGKQTNHPVQMVNWFDAVKWCNARSEREGLTPVYYLDPGFTQVYRSGTNAPYVNWSTNGYRLPTEAEWEKAARGGLSGQRFPWGNTISETQANYFGETSIYSYDLGPDGYNATFATGGFPFTSPVGYFPPNAYGLCDMSGNAFEWCWDWFNSPYAGGTDPHGGPPALTRIVRGGCWSFGAAGAARCAARGGDDPTDAPSPGSISISFRCVRGM